MPDSPDRGSGGQYPAVQTVRTASLIPCWSCLHVNINSNVPIALVALLLFIVILSLDLSHPDVTPQAAVDKPAVRPPAFMWLSIWHQRRIEVLFMLGLPDLPHHSIKGPGLCSLHFTRKKKTKLYSQALHFYTWELQHHANSGSRQFCSSCNLLWSL